MKNKIICGIYMITSPSGKIYIGQSIDIYNRLNAYKKYKAKGSWRLHCSLKRYGWENHKKEIIRVCKESQLNFWEKYYEKMYGSWNTPWGLNVRECGGSKGRIGEESKKKMRETHSKRLPITEKTRKNMSIAQLNRPPATDEARKNMSEAKKNYFKNNISHLKGKKTGPMSDEHKKRTSEGTKSAMANIDKNKRNEMNKKISEKLKHPWSEERKAKRRGKIPWNKGMKGVYHIKPRKKGYKLTSETLAKRAATRATNKERNIKEGIIVKKKPRTPEHTAKIQATKKANRELIRQEKAMMIF